MYNMRIELGLIRKAYPTDKQTNILILLIYGLLYYYILYIYTLATRKI